MKIQVLNNILDEQTFDKTVSIYKDLINSQEMDYQGNGWGRLYKHRHWWFDYLHNNQILKVAKEMFGNEIKPSYSFLSYYHRPDSVCPIHTDRPQCRYSLDMVVFQDEMWPIYVDFKKIEVYPNQASCYSGTHHIHWRDKIKNNNKIGLAFFHFTDSDFKGDRN